MSFLMEYCTAIGGGDWSTITAPVFTPVEVGVYQWIDDGTQTSGGLGKACFYRLRVQLP